SPKPSIVLSLLHRRAIFCVNWTMPVSWLVKPDSLIMSMLLRVESLLWSIIGDAGFVVSSVAPSAQALLSFHLLTGKLGSRPTVICSIAFHKNAAAGLYRGRKQRPENILPGSSTGRTEEAYIMHRSRLCSILLDCSADTMEAGVHFWHQ